MAVAKSLEENAALPLACRRAALLCRGFSREKVDNDNDSPDHGLGRDKDVQAVMLVNVSRQC
jgi:hypothetical protein